ncbi:hypothetical protein LCGC14_0720610 [marine sediment metagenome]|uniref:Uncharacterized protein n=1 Tax=marine sediment metagenome TaxID=412755 RepID=A0A0F9SXW3_9ZZZZ
MARRKKIVIVCPFCDKDKDYWVDKSATELGEVQFCSYCGESFNRKGEVVLRN